MKFSVSIEQLNDLLLHEHSHIIDIRDNDQYQMDHIPGAISVPKQQLLMMPEKFMNHKDRYYLYCNYGVTSGKVRDQLLSKGYHVVNIDGGFSTYKNVNHF